MKCVVLGYIFHGLSVLLVFFFSPSFLVLTSLGFLVVVVFNSSYSCMQTVLYQVQF